MLDNNLKGLTEIYNKEHSGPEKSNNIIPFQEFNIPILGIKSIRQISWLILSKGSNIKNQMSPYKEHLS